MGTLTIRNLDDNVKRELRKRAAARGVSMEQEVRDVLSESVVRNVKKPSRRATLEEILALGIKPERPFDQKVVSDELWSYLEEEMSFVVDSSALIAVLKIEDDVERIGFLLASDSRKSMSAGNLMECGTVVGRQFGAAGLKNMRALLDVARIEIVPVDAEQAEVGTSAYLHFGKGSGHRANLNFGDCFAYALAKTRNLPLLFKGDDFIHTDIEPALQPA